jgi:hypothetical protein
VFAGVLHRNKHNSNWPWTKRSSGRSGCWRPPGRNSHRCFSAWRACAGDPCLLAEARQKKRESRVGMTVESPSRAVDSSLFLHRGKRGGVRSLCTSSALLRDCLARPDVFLMRRLPIAGLSAAPPSLPCNSLRLAARDVAACGSAKAAAGRRRRYPAGAPPENH